MKRLISQKSVSIFLLSFLVFTIEISFAQPCESGGCSNFVKQYPSGTFATTSSSWTTVSTTINAGNYQLYNVVQGNTYEWSYCENATGQAITWDPQLTLYNNSNIYTPLCFVKDYCGLAPAINWTATFTGTVRLLTSAYINGTGCQSNGTSSPWNKLVWRQSATGDVCTPPSKPTGLTATAVSSSEIDLSWNAVSGAIGYDLSYCDGTYIGFVSGTTYKHTGRVENTTYSYKVQAQKSSTCVSGFTSCASATTPASCTPPSKPTGLTATAVSSSEIDLSWNAVSGAIGYDLSYCDGTYIGFVSGTTYKHTGRVENTTYSYKVQAQKSSTCVSGFTSCVSATTPVVDVSQIQWSGYIWNVKNGIGNPGSNNWAANSKNIWVDNDGNLHLKIFKDGEKWYCSEIYSQLSFGYGEYTFQVSTNVETFDKNIVLGLFTYESDIKEVDIEFSHWGTTNSPFGWYVVQPSTSSSRNNFPLNLTGDYSTHKFKWDETEILFQSYHGHGTDYLINEWKYTGVNNPAAGNEKVHLNFWLYNGLAPSNNMEAEVVIKSFTFKEVSNSGNLSVILQNIDNSTTPFPGSNGKLLLYNPAYIYQNKYAKTNSSGIGIFSDLAYGDYNIEAFHIPDGENSTIFGEEFWGAKKVKFSPDSKTETIVRNMPYFTGCKAINVKTGEDVTGGSITTGTELRVEVKVLNPNASNQKIKARLVIDKDKLLTVDFDFDKLSEENMINAKTGNTEGTKTINSFTFIPAQSGEYYSSVGIQTNTRESAFPYTDGTKWSKFITVTDAAPTGNLTVSVKNIPEGNLSLPGNNGVVELYNSKNEKISTKSTDINGEVTFSNIIVGDGDGYYIKVFHKIPSNLQDEYWGTQRDIVIKANTTVTSTFTRNQPYGGDIRVFNGTTDVTGQTVEPGTNLKIRYTITNPSTTTISAKGTVYLDESKSAPWEISPISGNLQTISPSGKITQEFTYTTQRGGTFYAYGLVNIDEGGLTIYSDNTAWGDEPIIRINIPQYSINLLDAFVNKANNLKDENGDPIKPLDELYKENKKVFYFSEKQYTFPTLPPITLGVNIFIDLVDIYSYTKFKNGILDKAVSKEGSEGWVTVWINGKVGSAIGYGANTGITAPVTIRNNEWDPTMRLEFEGSELKSPFYNVSAVESDGINWGEIKEVSTNNLKLSAFELGFNISRFEMNIDRINEIFNNSYKSSLSDGLLTSNSTNSFFSKILDLDNLKLVPNKSLKEYDESRKSIFRPFSSNDNNIVGVEGVINFLNGGMDKNNDMIKDNVYPVIPKVYGLTHPDNQAILTFQNTSEDETADFYIKVVNVPYGWIIDSQDKKENTLLPEKQDYTFAFFGAPKSLWNTFHSTNWTIGCIDAFNAPDVAELTFELWHNKSGFDKLLQTKKLTVHKQKADGNIAPTISGLKATVKSENPTKNIEISWTDSDPDDDATIAIAIDFDKLGEKPWEGSGTHRWIKTDINETSSINTFNWDISGIPIGTYSLWAVIYDGKNQPQYIKSNNEISISSLFDPEKPYVKINSNNIEWLSNSKKYDIDFIDNAGLNDVFYQLIKKDLNKNAVVANYSQSEKYAELLLNDSNWNFLTSNGTSILPESQFSLKDSLTEDWQISNSDWENMVNNSKNGETYYLFLKATDDAGNVFISNDESEVLEIRVDVYKPNITITYPAEGQKIDSKTIEVKWAADDLIDGLELSGLDSIYIALDQSTSFVDLNGNTRTQLFSNLSDGIHKVYLKAKDKAGNFSELKMAQFSVNFDIPLAVVDVTGISDPSMHNVHVSGIISDDNGTEIVSKGFCWSTNVNPTTALSSKTEEGSGEGIFFTQITGLDAGATYYLRAYATNCAGTGYSENYKFTTQSTEILASLVTSNVTEIGIDSAKTGGNITSDNETTVTERGVCWSTVPNPTINDTRTIDGNGTGQFVSTITGLTAGTTYYVRAYATNSAGTSYGNELNFTTLPKEQQIVTDIDGNEYTTVTIGTQVWLGQNLKTTRYNDGTSIPLVTDNNVWNSLSSPAYCWYNNDIGYKDPYGALYNWYAVNTEKLCPPGWHVPSSAEWNTLVNYLGGDAIAGGKMKETGDIHWIDPNIDATNSSGYDAVAAGYRNAYLSGFHGLGYIFTIWTSSEYHDLLGAYSYCLQNNTGAMSGFGNGEKFYGQSVRCIRDQLVGNDEIKHSNLIKIYPNPATDKFFIECSSGGLLKCDVQIINIEGRKLREWSNIDIENIQSFDIHNINAGIYFVNIVSGEINISKKLVIKQK